MTSFATLLYPTDFSPASHAAWPVVEALATASGGKVIVLHIMPEVPEDHRTGPTERAKLEAGYHRRAEESIAALLAKSSVPHGRVQTILAHGVAEVEIVNHAHIAGADAIVMGARGWSGLLRWALGSVTHHVIQAAPCPVLTVGPRSQEEVDRRVT